MTPSSAHSSSWINAKHIDQWRATLATYASPVIGNLDVSHIEDAHIEKILKPIWNTRHETAMRLRSRLERIITWTIVKKLREGPNPARWSGHLEVLLPKFERITKNHPALHWRDMAAFMVELRKQQGIAARAVEFAILTGARSNEVRRMEWSEIDWDHGLWIVPATHMGKTKKEHRVCLSAASIRVLEVQKRTAKGGIVFPGVRGQALSDMALLLVLRRMGRSDITVHGFRSTFATWVGDGEHFPIEMAQFALSHKVGTKVEQVYMRTTMVEKRRRMMDAWARHCDASATSATVVSIQSNTAASR